MGEMEGGRGGPPSLQGRKAVDTAMAALMNFLHHASEKSSGMEALPSLLEAAKAARQAAALPSLAAAASGSSGTPDQFTAHSVRPVPHTHSLLSPLHGSGMWHSSFSLCVSVCVWGGACQCLQLQELEERRDALRAELAKRQAAVDDLAKHLWHLHAHTAILLASPSSLSSPANAHQAD